MWWLLIIFAVLFYIFFVRPNGRSGQERGYSDESIDGVLIQKILLATKKQLPPGYEPIDTVYVNRNPDGTVESRFMFLDLGKYSGVQYDVKANMNKDGTVSVSAIETSVPSELEAAYKPFIPDQTYADYSEIKFARVQ